MLIFAFVRFRISILFFFTISTVHAQLYNRTFLDKRYMQSAKVGISLEALQYLKNNEYFNNINPGETLFGFQGKAQLHYRLNDKFLLSGGLLLQKDYGDPKFISHAYPLLHFYIQKNVWAFHLGNIQPHVNHELIEPMLNYENIIRQPVEYGFQATRRVCGSFYDVWLNWKQNAQKDPGRQEQIVFGQSFYTYRAITKRITFSNPVQAIVYHQGGQSLNLNTHLRTVVNLAAGLHLGMKFRDSGTGMFMEGFALGSLDNSPALSQPFKNGWASMSNIGFMLHRHQVVASWWYAREFYSPLGNAVFNNFNTENPYANASTRRLIMLRYVYTKPLGNSGINLDFRLEPYYDMEVKKLEFSQSLYFRYTIRHGFRIPKWLKF